jgi:hypothetical protein
MGVSFALRRNDGNRRIELQGGHQRAFKQVTANGLFENGVAAKRFRREVTFAPDLFKMQKRVVILRCALLRASKDKQIHPSRLAGACHRAGEAGPVGRLAPPAMNAIALTRG